MWDWDSLREAVIKYGMYNSLLTALPPTASTSQILGNYESFEPVTNNIFMRSTLGGDFPVVNRYLVRDLQSLGLWSRRMKEKIVYHNGSVQAISEIPDNIYILDVLSDEDSLKLLRRLTPEAVKKHERSLGSLIKTLEGLPLALRVAGSLLEKEQTLGLDVEGLIRELTEKHHWIQETAPTTYFDEETGQTPTIALLFQKSVETLQPADQEAFANLGVFASKPATFDLKAIAFVCELDDPIPTLKALVDHGLLEPLGNARFQMHYTLSLYAKSLQDP
jgi:hypothetical protein